jgi:hypothetical protein
LNYFLETATQSLLASSCVSWGNNKLGNRVLKTTSKDSTKGWLNLTPLIAESIASRRFEMGLDRSNIKIVSNLTIDGSRIKRLLCISEVQVRDLVLRCCIFQILHFPNCHIHQVVQTAL